jgi:hypothetical protein
MAAVLTAVVRRIAIKLCWLSWWPILGILWLNEAVSIRLQGPNELRHKFCEVLVLRLLLRCLRHDID